MSLRNVLATIFWDINGLLLIESKERGATVNTKAFCETLRRLRRAIQNRRRGLHSRELVLRHNARMHAAAITQVQLDNFHWDVFPHSLYSPDIAPSDYNLFPHLKKFLGDRRLAANDDEVKTG